MESDKGAFPVISLARTISLQCFKYIFLRTNATRLSVFSNHKHSAETVTHGGGGRSRTVSVEDVPSKNSRGKSRSESLFAHLKKYDERQRDFSDMVNSVAHMESDKGSLGKSRSKARSKFPRLKSLQRQGETLEKVKVPACLESDKGKS